jgi:hypothetical protein
MPVANVNGIELNYREAGEGFPVTQGRKYSSLIETRKMDIEQFYADPRPGRCAPNIAEVPGVLSDRRRFGEGCTTTGPAWPSSTVAWTATWSWSTRTPAPAFTGWRRRPRASRRQRWRAAPLDMPREAACD